MCGYLGWVTDGCGSIALVKSIRDPRNVGSALVIAAVFALVYLSLFSRALGKKTRAQLSAATMWLVLPFVPCLWQRC